MYQCFEDQWDGPSREKLMGVIDKAQFCSVLGLLFAGAQKDHVMRGLVDAYGTGDPDPRGGLSHVRCILPPTSTRLRLPSSRIRLQRDCAGRAQRITDSWLLAGRGGRGGPGVRARGARAVDSCRHVVEGTMVRVVIQWSRRPGSRELIEILRFPDGGLLLIKPPRGTTYIIYIDLRSANAAQSNPALGPAVRTPTGPYHPLPPCASSAASHTQIPSFSPRPPPEFVVVDARH